MSLIYKFQKPLIEGVIKSRPNRFIMNVQISNGVFKCHCPVTGRIGEIHFSDVPCLLSESDNLNRKTRYTVEAISLDSISRKNKTWIGINQTKINVYVEFFIKNNCLPKMITGKNISREKRLGNSRIDFLIDNTYLEVKMPLISFPFENSKSDFILQKPKTKFNSFDRLIKHFNDLSTDIKNHRAIVLLAFIYDAPAFTPPKSDNTNNVVRTAAKQAAKKGIENWQINLKINKTGIELQKYFKLKLFGVDVHKINR